MASIKTRATKQNQKFGIEIPRSVDRALAIDRETQTNFWQKAIDKEIHHVKVAFTILDDGAPEPILVKLDL
jgi:hypothetical protein